jgi:hypothetical protein
MWELRWWAERCDYLAKQLNKTTSRPAMNGELPDDFVWKEDFLNDG